MQALSLSSPSDPGQDGGSDLGLTMGRTHQHSAWKASGKGLSLAVGNWHVQTGEHAGRWRGGKESWPLELHGSLRDVAGSL